MDHHESHLSQLIRSARLALREVFSAVLIVGAAGAWNAASAEVTENSAPPPRELALWAEQWAWWSERPWVLNASIGAPNILSASFGVLHGLGLRSQLTAGVSPLPLGSAGTFIATCFEALGAYHPHWQNAGPFFVGAGVGFQSLNLNTAIRLGSLASDVSSPTGAIGWQNFYAAASVGWLWLKPSGFFWGFDLSVRVPIVGWGGIYASSSGSPALATSLSSAGGYALSRYARLVYPSLTLIRLGWVF